MDKEKLLERMIMGNRRLIKVYGILSVGIIMSPPEGLGDILFLPGRLSVCLSVTNRVRSVT